MSVSSSPSREDSGKESSSTEKGTDQQQQQQSATTQQEDPAQIMIQTAYTKTKQLLEASASGLVDNISSVVSLKNLVESPPLDEAGVRLPYPGTMSPSNYQYSSYVSLLTPNRGHHAIYRALEKLEGLEKEEAELQFQSNITTELTKIVTGDDAFNSPRHAIETLEALSQSVPRKICQHPFKKNDIMNY